MTKSGALAQSWQAYLAGELKAAYMLALKKFLQEEKHSGKIIYPPGKEIFNAFNQTDFEAVKIVILGQDPYHGPHQAHGLCFSVRQGVPLPPSLLNIFKEIEQDLGLVMSGSGDLTPWAQQGVLLLNATLTVEHAKAGSHQNKGWEQFTDQVIARLNQERQHLVFLLWGSYAQQKGKFIDTQRHLVLKSPHPSPLSAHRGFFGNRHFSKANAYLQNHGQTPINWLL
jgi:uracil-DNA glycosylase